MVDINWKVLIRKLWHDWRDEFVIFVNETIRSKDGC